MVIKRLLNWALRHNEESKKWSAGTKSFSSPIFDDLSDPWNEDSLEWDLAVIRKRIPAEYGKTIDCDSGWHQIIVDCDRALQKIDPDYVPIQIKQKFGGLRFYFNTKFSHPANPNIDSKYEALMATVRYYEDLASVTCEISGTPGVLMKKGSWLRTLNPDFAPEGYEIVVSPF